MKKMSFFSHKNTSAAEPQAPLAPEPSGVVVESTDIKQILSHPKPGSLVILDIDDTIGRVSQTIGLDAWFRFRIEQYANEGHSDSMALSSTIEIYNQAQLASPGMIDVDSNNPTAALIQALKDKGSQVIALTARNLELTDKTLSFLEGLGVCFSDNVLRQGTLTLNERQVEVKKGVIFANGTNKGACLELLLKEGHFVSTLCSYRHISFVDDSKRNCDAIAETLTKLEINDCSIWHYTYAARHLPFEAQAQSRAKIQEAHLLENGHLLTDEEADLHSLSLS